MASWDSPDTPGAECERLDLAEATRLFFPPWEGGKLLPTRVHPAPDSHREVRCVCARCPMLRVCLSDAMVSDAWYFRGGLSAVERAALGGVRDPRSRPAGGIRDRLTAEGVWARVQESALPVDEIRGAVADWAARVAKDRSA